MKTMPAAVLRVATASAAVCLTAGCAMFRASVTEVDVEKDTHLRATYDYSDMRNLTQEMVGYLLASDFVAGQPKPPIVMIAGVQNRTKGYVDTKAMTDSMRTILLQSGKMQFINEARRDELLKEQAYQRGNVTPEQQVALGKQSGARYMLSGSLVQMDSESMRQVRVSKQEINYYKLTLEITDLESSLIVWTKEKEFARSARKPLIGW